MRLKQPRLEPLDPESLDPAVAPRMGDGPVLNIFRTLAHHPDLAKSWLVFGSHVLGNSTLPPREREIAILRVGFLCRSGYEWAQHVEIGRRVGLSDEEIARIADGADAPGFSAAERAVLRATDELHADAFVQDDTWAELGEHFDARQLLDLLFTVGQYQMVSMVLNSAGVQYERELPELPWR